MRGHVLQANVEILGGAARNDGISFLSRTHISITKKRGGKTVTYVSQIHGATNRWLGFITDLFQLLSAKSSLDLRTFIQGTVSFCVFLVVALIWHHLYHGPYFYTPLIILLLVLSGVQSFVSVDKRKYHAAEHMVVNTFQQGLPITFEVVSRASRVSVYCGTNAVVFIATVFLFGVWFFPESDHLWFILSVLIGTILFGHGESKLTRPLFQLGALLQERVFTAPPDKEHIELAVQGATILIQHSRDTKTGLRFSSNEQK